MSERKIIKQRAVVSDPADYAIDGAAGSILPLADWLAKVGVGGTAISRLPGVWLAPEDDPAALHPYLDQIKLIAVRFPRFVEGRGYSTGYLLRQRLGYRGELRAFGDLGRDHLWQLARVGFDSFDLRDGTDLDDALAAFDDFPERYQGSVDEAAPLYRRREVAHG
jgi:uncharacterized protein (DUF934 family)